MKRLSTGIKKKTTRRLGRVGVSLTLLALYLPTLQASQTMTLSESKRVEATICATAMNRLTVTNDRIIQIFGDEGTFESQNDESSGQVFLKPTLENGTKPLSLTLITEQGTTQDLTLKPTAKEPTTVIFKSPQKAPKMEEVSGTDKKNTAFQEHVLNRLKQAVRESLPLKEESPPQRPTPEGFALIHQRSFQGDGCVIHEYRVQNRSEKPVQLHEKLFYTPGDLAISCRTRSLAKDATTQLYVVSHEAGYTEDA